MPLSQAREKLLGRLHRRKSREREGLFLVEGVRSVSEALDAKLRAPFAVVSPKLAQLGGGETLLARLRAATEVHEVEDDDLRSLADTETPQGVLLVCEEPRAGFAELGPTRGPLELLVVDGVQDPGNLGTLLRAAAAFALHAVIVLDGTVDPYNPKAVRGAAGALFRIPVVRTDWTSAGEWLRERGARLLVAEASGTDVADVDPSPAWALVVGNEGAGVRGEIRSAAHGVVSIPMPGGTESLNAGVAGAVLLYALTRTARDD